DLASRASPESALHAIPTLFPYTTLFRSRKGVQHHARQERTMTARRSGGRKPAATGAARPAGRKSVVPDARVSTASSGATRAGRRSEEHTSELQSRENLVCRRLLEKKNTR